MHVHILGIGGTFMAGVAGISQAIGHTVTGTDQALYEPMKSQLNALNIPVSIGYSAGSVPETADVVVVGNALSRGNPAVENIISQRMRIISGPEWLASQVLRHKTVIAVSGTHGKTTTASLLTWALEVAGFNPGFLIGGIPENFGTSFRLTDSPFFIIEADEYDTAFFDKRPKLLHTWPSIAVINNLEFDHADIYPNLAAIEQQFSYFLRLLPEDGYLVYPEKNEAIQRVIERGFWSHRCPVGEGSEWRCEWMPTDTFTLSCPDLSAPIQARIPLRGAHNAANILSAVRAAYCLGVSPEIAFGALESFETVKRRLEWRKDVGGVRLFDDFGHHPTAIQQTLEAAKACCKGRVHAVIDPHSNTMEKGELNQQLAIAVQSADELYLYAHKGLAYDPVAFVESLSVSASTQPDALKLAEVLSEKIEPGDDVIVFSNSGQNEVLLSAISNALTTRFVESPVV